MKIAICGKGPIGLKASEFLSQLGAEALSFDTQDILRVHKTFLTPGELPPSGSRLVDLFRVVTRQDEHCERFQDFDLVIDAREKSHFPRNMGPGGVLTLNESEVKEAPDVFYGERDWEKLTAWLDKGKSLAVIGSGRVALKGLMDLGPWIFENRLSLITNEEVPFNRLRLEQTNPQLIAFWEQALDHWERDYKNQCEDYRQKLMEYREQGFSASEPPPEPNPPLDILSRSSVVAIDRLSDQPGLFLTAEEAAFLVENADHKTLHVDGVFVATGHEIDNDIFCGLHLASSWDRSQEFSPLQPEPGLYCLRPDSDNDLTVQMKMIEQDILSYFSRVK